MADIKTILATFLELAQKEIGTKETPDHHNPRILEYDSTTYLKAKSDQVPWCSAFVNFIVTKAQEELGLDLHPTNSSMARSWLKWGTRSVSPFIPGSILIMKRDNSPILGHVGFWISQTKLYHRILSGNTGETVEYMSVPDHAILDIRVPSTVWLPHEI